MNNLRELPSPRGVPQGEHDRGADPRDPVPDLPRPDAKHGTREPLPENPRYDPDHEAPARRSPYAFAHQKLEVVLSGARDGSASL